MLLCLGFVWLVRVAGWWYSLVCALLRGFGVCIIVVLLTGCGIAWFLICVLIWCGVGFYGWRFFWCGYCLLVVGVVGFGCWLALGC